MNKNWIVLSAIVAIGAAGSLGATGAAASTITTFDDTLNAANGTALAGHAADIGGAWVATTDGGTPTLQITSNSVDTKGAARVYTNTFTQPLSAALPILTFTIDNQATGGSFFSAGYAGYTLQAGSSGGTLFVGDANDNTTGWDVAPTSGGGTGEVTSGNNTVANIATLTYNYDTGAYSLALSSGTPSTISGVTTPGLAFDRFFFSNNGGGDLKFGDTGGTTGTPAFQVTASPEPASFGLAGLAALGLLRRRRSAR